MFRGGGKDLDLTSPRAKDWKYKSVESGKLPKPSAVEVRVINNTPSPRSTYARASISGAAGDTDVLGRFNTLGKVGLGASAVMTIIGLAIFRDWFGEGDGWFLVFPAIIALLFFRAVVISAVAGAISLLKHNGRAIWVEGDVLKAIDWWNGRTSIRFDQFTAVKFDPAYRRGKATQAALLLMRPDRKPYAIGIRHIDTPGSELANRIELIRSARPATRA